ncbi:MAG: MATE family efflux transporter [Propionibacteriaceae bacterium]|nr:MATE family efflux transporter [Propionibacteriaceae bacterium]
MPPPSPHLSLRERVLRQFSGPDFTHSQVFALLIPLVIDGACMVVMDVANTAIISSSGAAAISAVSTVAQLHWLIVGTFIAIALGGTVMVSQSFGRADRERMGRMAAATLKGLLGVVVVYTTILIIFHRPLATALFGRAEADVMAGIHVFFLGHLISYPGRGLIIAANGILRGIGRTRVTLALSLISNGLNICFNLILVLWLGLGIEGLAIAVIASQYIGASVAVYLLHRRRDQLNLRRAYLFSLDWTSISRVFILSLPFIAEDLFFNGGKLVVQTFIVSFGTYQMAAHAIVASWMRIGEIGPQALSAALVPIVGRSMGRGDIAFARKITRTFVITGMIACLVVNVLLLPVFPLAIRYFYHAPVQTYTVLWIVYIMGIVLYPALFSASAIIPAALRSAGDGVYTTIGSLTSMWVYRLGVGYIVSIALGFGLIGLWAVWMTEWGVRALIFGLRYRGNRWYQHNVLG